MLQFQTRDGEDHRALAPIVGEELETESVAEAARWVRVYGELVALHEDRLIEGPRARSSEIEAVLDQLRGRLEEWRERHLALAGMDFDPYARYLTIAGRSIHLTRREAQLLDFLLERPGQFFTSEVLIRDAWEDPRLAPEQVRTYIVRLRRKLEESNAPAQLLNKPRLGYALNVDPNVRSTRPRRAS